MGSNTTKKVLIGTAMGLAAGYVVGILTAPKSGRETRQDIKDVSTKAWRAAEIRLKQLYRDMGDLIEQATDKARELRGLSKRKLEDLVDDTKEAQYKVKEVLSAIHDGDADDPELDMAIKQATEARQHLKNYLAKHE
jgi:gas vesicle protein